MRPAAFEYVAPDSVEEAVEALLAFGPEAKVVAGGQSLVPLMNLRLMRPSALVDLRNVPGLTGIKVGREAVTIGAMTTHAEIEASAEIAGVLPVMTTAARQIGHPAIRNRGTIGGSIAYADPTAEWPSVAVALDAQVSVVGGQGRRFVPARELFVTYMTTVLAEDEIVTSIEFPVPDSRSAWAFREVARQPGAFSIALAVTGVSLDPQGEIDRVVVGIGGCAPTPIAVELTDGQLKGAEWSDGFIAEVSDEIVGDLEPTSDIHADSEDRRTMMRSLIAAGLADAVGKARAS